MPILVGGSGLYVSSVIYDFRFPGTDAGIRERLEAELEQHGPGMHVPAAGRRRPGRCSIASVRSNGRRLVRALEVIELTGEPFGASLPEEPVPWMPTVDARSARARAKNSTARLDARVERMWRAGLVDEVAALLPAGVERGVTASRAIGYAQALAQLHGTLSEARGDRADAAAHPPVRAPAGQLVQAVPGAALARLRRPPTRRPRPR